MKKKTLRRAHHHRVVARRTGHTEHYLVVVRGWMLLIAFALMLGLGAIVGNYINTQLDLASPAVAGVTTGR